MTRAHLDTLDRSGDIGVGSAVTEADFSQLLQLLTRICNVPSALVTLFEDGKHRVCASLGLEAEYLAEALALCTLASQSNSRDMASAATILSGQMIPAGRLRFFAADPLLAQNGKLLGMMTLMSREACDFSDLHKEALRILSSQLAARLELEQQHQMLQQASNEQERMSAALQQNAGRLAQMGGWSVSLPDHRVIWSEEIARILQIPPGTRLTLEQGFKLIPGPWREVVESAFSHCVRDGISYDKEFPIETLQGRRIWVRAVGHAVQDTAGRTTAINGALQDITARKQAEEKMRRLSNRLSSTLESISDAFFITNQEWRIIYLNHHAELLLQCTRSQLLGRPIWDALPGATGSRFYRQIQQAQQEGCKTEFEDFVLPLNRWLEIRAYPSEEGVAICLRDITDRHRITQTLRESEERFKNVARATTDAIWDWDPASDLIWWNEGFTRLFGFDAGGLEPRMRCWADRIHAEDQARVISSLWSVVAGSEECWNDEYRFERKDGSWAHVLDRGFVIRDRNGIAVQMVGGMTDVTEKRSLEKMLINVASAASVSTGEKFFEQMVRKMTDAVGAQASHVARLLPGNPMQATTVCAVEEGRLAENFRYQVQGTPAEYLNTASQWVIPDQTHEHYPRCGWVAQGKMQACAGLRLDDSAGEPIGVLCALFRHSLDHCDFIASMLKIFAARIASELERQGIEMRLRNQASLLDKARDAIIVRDLDHHIRFWNKSAERLYGWTEQEALGRTVIDLLYQEPSAFNDASKALLRDGAWSGEIAQRCKDGTIIMVEAHWTLVRDEEGCPHQVFAINTDITQRKATERKIEQLAFYDQLTGLPNRLFLLDRLQHALAASARSQHNGALMFIDLDNFKTLNDTLGHDVGDQLLKQVARRLESSVRESDTVARLGGDEFVALLEDLSPHAHEAATQARMVGEKILSAMNQPYQLGIHQHHSTPSIGLTLFKGHHDNVEETLKRADIAMYQAKQAGRNALRFFDPEMQAAVTSRAGLEADLRQSSRDNQFQLYYQPQMAGRMQLAGVEALLRWQHPTRGMVPPAQFIPLAEDSGLIMSLGRWVLETACRQLAAWTRQPQAAQLSISVNVSARQFHHPDFVAQVLTVLEATGADPQRLKLELTESLLILDIEDTIAKISALKDKGIGFSLDDFGTGYSSLAYLKRLPLDQIKIDQSFIRDVLTDPHDAAIARTIVTLGKSLNLSVLAEGVETEAQCSFLASEGCHAYQGYFFQRPLPIDQLSEFLGFGEMSGNHYRPPR